MNSNEPDPAVDQESDGDNVSEQNIRTKGVLAILGLVGLGVFLFFVTSVSGGPVVTERRLNEHAYKSRISGTDPKAPRLGIAPSTMVLERTKVLDTVYTTDSVYLEINLTHQNVTVHHRNGTARTFRISSGNPYISQGMATPTGLFTVQNMTPMALSRQFNNARLHHWVGIQGGVGFHGLDGSGYYGYLGVRPSSHGCVRMSREEIADMYKLVHPGAMIMSHYGKPARVIAFCDPGDTVGALVIDSAAVYNRNLGKERLRMFYEGNYWVAQEPRIVHLAGQRLRWGMEIGDLEKIPKQKVPSRSMMTSVFEPTGSERTDRLEHSRMSNWYLAGQIALDSTIRDGQAKLADERVEYGG